jgi:hypothetical protein
VFVGPYFGYRPTSATTWQWTTNNWLLHLLPGAVAVVGGLMVLAASPLRRAGRAGAPLGLAALLLVAAGAWFVIGPALWPTFQSSPPFATGTGAWTSFWNQLGANLGPGVLLAALGGMALKASLARPAVAIEEAPGMVAGPDVGVARRDEAPGGVVSGREAGVAGRDEAPGGVVAGREAGVAGRDEAPGMVADRDIAAPKGATTPQDMAGRSDVAPGSNWDPAVNEHPSAEEPGANPREIT